MGASTNGQTGAAADATEAAEAARSRRFQALALPHLDAAYNLARWLSRNPRDAEDIVQEAFLRAFRFFDSFRGELARPWLLTIVRRVWYDEWRRRATSEEVALFDELRDDAPPQDWETASADPEALAIRAEDIRDVQAALERLPVAYREVLVLREIEELSYREIAQIADLPLGTVMSRLARGRRQLAALLAARRCQEPGGATGNGAREAGSGGAPGASVRETDGRSREAPAADGAAAPQIGGAMREAPDEL